MKIYDPNSKRILKSVTLYLTPDEAAELSSASIELSDDPQKHHSHIMDDKCESEITIAVYTKENIKLFDA